MADITNLPSKISRAIVAYLVGAGIIPLERAYYYRTRRTRTLDNGPILTVDVLPGTPAPAFTGNETFTVHIAIKGSAVALESDANDETEAIAFDALVGQVRAALMTADDGDTQTLRTTRDLITAAARGWAVPVDDSPTATAFAATHADMADFTVLWWSDASYGQGRAEDCEWEIVLQFNCTACESALE